MRDIFVNWVNSLSPQGRGNLIVALIAVVIVTDLSAVFAIVMSTWRGWMQTRMEFVNWRDRRRERELR